MRFDCGNGVSEQWRGDVFANPCHGFRFKIGVKQADGGTVDEVEARFEECRIDFLADFHVVDGHQQIARIVGDEHVGGRTASFQLCGIVKIDVVGRARTFQGLAVFIVAVDGDQVCRHAQMSHVLCDVLPDTTCGHADDARIRVSVHYGARRSTTNVHVHATDDHNVTVRNSIS